MQCAISALRCLSAIAALLLVASVTPVAGEPDAGKLDDHQIAADAPGVTLASLNPGILNSQQHETERTTVPNTDGRIFLSAADAIVGIASFYDEPQKTASGEAYDPNAFTAAAQLEIRDKFGGIRYGRLYQPAYGLGEYDGKKVIVRFNDVGPLRPGRKFDLSRAAMAYFDSSLDKGLLPDFKMTPLPLGRAYPEGPVTDQQLVELGIDDDAAENVCAVVLDKPKPIAKPVLPTIKAARWGKAKSRAALRMKAKARSIAKVRAWTKAKARAYRLTDKRRIAGTNKIRLAAKATAQAR
jgi:rare lipoprotein A